MSGDNRIDEMKVIIYYGGRGLIEDPTLYVLNKVESILDELRVKVDKYNLFEMKSTIPTLPQTLKDVDVVILAVSVEWYGIGGYMQEFLDACWLYGNKNKISKIYMFPIVISTTYGEKEAITHLNNAWELFGGIVCPGICAYVENTVDFEMNKEYGQILERKTEDLYRTISQKRKMLPSSSYAIKQNIMKESLDLTPQESEQLSKYASDDIYVKQQKEDIEELTSMFKGMLSRQDINIQDNLMKDFEKVFSPQDNLTIVYNICIEDKKENKTIIINDSKLKIINDTSDDADVTVKLSSETINEIVKGKSTFQKAFMVGKMTSRGDFKNIRLLDMLFPFS